MIHHFLIIKGYGVTTLGIDKSEDYRIDLGNAIPILNERFKVVIHVAGLAHAYPKTKMENEQFDIVNYQGTINLCKSLERTCLPKSFIYISSVAVYGLEEGKNINESYPLLGTTPYARSKIKAEIFLKDWCQRHNIVCGILRPALIAGPDPPGNLGAMINGISKGTYLRIGKGSARRSMVLAEDVAGVIPKLMITGGTFNMCDNYHPSFIELERILAKQVHKNDPVSIPVIIAKLLAILGDLMGNKSIITTKKLKKITSTLTFSNDLAKSVLGYQPRDVLGNFYI